MIPLDNDPEKLAVFVQEYIRREQQADAGVVAVISSGLRHPQYLPHHVAEYLLGKPEIQAAIKAVRSFYKPADVKEVSAQSLLTDAEDVYQRCVDDRQYNAAISAKKLQAEILGILKQQVDVNVRHVVTMSDSDLERVARSGIIDGEYKEVKGLPSVRSANDAA